MSVGVGVGLMGFPFSTASAFWRWIDLCDAGGVDSYWQSDRIVTDEPYLETMSAMAALAGRTRRLKFGMNVVSMAFREPVLLAKQCATIDQLSDGRLLPAFGIGNPRSADWRALGVDPGGRGRRTDEALDVIARLWRGERVTLESDCFSLDEARISPLPVQQPLPLWIGGSSPAAIRRTARLGTGWIGGLDSPAQAARVVDGVLAACRESGRAFPADHFGASFFFRFGRADEPVVTACREQIRARSPERDPAHAIAAGGEAEILARIEEYLAGGVTKFVLRPLGDSDDDLQAQTRLLVERLLPEVGALNARLKAAAT